MVNCSWNFYIQSTTIATWWEMFPLRNINSEVILQMSVCSLEGHTSQVSNLLRSAAVDSLSDNSDYSINYFQRPTLAYSFTLLLLKKSILTHRSLIYGSKLEKDGKVSKNISPITLNIFNLFMCLCTLRSTKPGTLRNLKLYSSPFKFSKFFSTNNSPYLL